MSMENAILVHAAALEKLAAAIGAAYGGSVMVTAELVERTAGTTLVEEKAADLADATKKRVAAALDAATKDAKQNAAGVKSDADLEQAVAKIEAKLDDAVQVLKGTTDTAEDDGLDTPLDYKKDVMPPLLAAIKRVGKDKVRELISTYGVDKADKIDPAKFPDLLARAQKLAA